MSNSNNQPLLSIGDEVLTVVPHLPHLNFQATKILDVIEKEDGFYYMTVLQQKEDYWSESTFLKLPSTQIENEAA